MLKVGIKGRYEMPVSDEETAVRVGSGLLPVFATPSMIARMERVASQSVAAFLAEGTTTVGIKVAIEHVAATPVGMMVVCESELIEIDRKRLVFSVTARDAAGEIGHGIHERCIVEKERFMQRVINKKGDKTV